MQDPIAPQEVIEGNDNQDTTEAPEKFIIKPADNNPKTPTNPLKEQLKPEADTVESKINPVRDLILHLSQCLGGTTDTDLEKLDITFGELCEKLKDPPEIGNKNGAYHVRGPFREGHPTRSDANLAYSSLIVLDADSSLDPKTGEVTQGAPSPEFVHEILAKLDINHILHTTHSHGQPGKGNRFRVLIPAVAENSDELSGYLSWIFHRLNSKGCWLADVRENHVWSQPWYYPRLASEDSEYLFFVYDAGEVFGTHAALAWYEGENAATVAMVEKATTSSQTRDPESIYAKFDDKHGNPKWMLSVLIDEGYSLKSTSQINAEVSYRLLSPHSNNGQAGVILFRARDGIWRVYSHHSANDPLSKEEDDVKTSDAWDLFRLFEHNDDEEHAMLAWEEANDERPIIKIRPGEIAPSLKALVEAIANTNPPRVFQRAQVLCRIAHLQETSETQGCSIPKGTAHIVTLHKNGLTVEAGESAIWMGKNAKGVWQKKDPCPKAIGALLEGVGKWGGIPTLLGISEAPILQQDGTLLAESGYDANTRLYVEGRFSQIVLPDEICLKQAQEAAQLLLEPFREFPFVEPRLDQAVLLAYMFTLALRPQLTTSPLFCISATTPGSGKGLVIEAANYLVRGRDAATMPPVQGGAGEDESRKRITALLIQGVASINLDNWTKPIGGESMNALLTTAEWTDRVLGASTTVSLPNRITLAATGNNLSVRGDTTRRAVLILLDPGVERPELREFEQEDLLGHIARNREALLTALFTILKAYQQAGHPGSQKKLLGRFEQWTAAVCGPIRWMGYPDPLETQERLRAQDPEAEKLELLLSAWFDLAGTDWKTVGDIIGATEEGFNSVSTPDQRSHLRDGLVEAAPDGRGKINRLKLGWYLKHFTGRVVGGFRLEKKPKTGKKSKNPQQYRVRDLAAPGGDE